VRQETVELCFQHIEELDNLEKRRFNEKMGVDREDLMKSDGTGAGPGPRRPYGPLGGEENATTGKGASDRKALFEGASNGKKKKGEADPFQSNLPAIDDDTELVNDDFRHLNERNEHIVCLQHILVF
jgi:hypothetical protein